MQFAIFLLSAAIVAAGQPPPECVTVAKTEGEVFGLKWISASLSQDGEWIAAVRRQNLRRGEEETWHVALWKVADLDKPRQPGGKANSEAPKSISAGTSAMNPIPTFSAELKDCAHPIGVCFAPNGDVVVLASEAQFNGYVIAAGKATRAKDVTPEEAKEAKAAGRRVSRRPRTVIVFLGRDDLAERQRWVNKNGDTSARLNAAHLFWFAEGQAILDFTDDAVRLLDDSTGEEFKRLTFDRARSDQKRGRPAWMWSQARVNDGKCWIVATCSQRHAVWKLAANRTVTKIAELMHRSPGPGGACAISPSGGIVALAPGRADSEHPGSGDHGQDEPGIQLWDVEGRRATKELIGHRNHIYYLDFSSDGKRLASVSLDMTMIVWDVATGERLVRRPLEGVPSTVQFSADGERVLTVTGATGPTGFGTRICLWNVDQMLKAEEASRAAKRR